MKSQMLIEDACGESYYRIACGCKYESVHDAHIRFKDHDGSIWMEFTTRVYWHDYYGNWWRRLCRRAKTAFGVMTKGWWELDGDFYLNDENLHAFEDAIFQSRARYAEWENRPMPTEKVSLKDLIGEKE